MKKGLEIRLYPSKEQRVLIDRTLGCTRFVYNHVLALKKELWDEYYVNVSVSSKSTYDIDDKGDRKIDKDIASTSIVATLTPKNAIVNDYRFNGKSEAPNIK